MITWLKSHISAILATALVVGKAGLLGKGATILISTMAAALGA
jgi:hypothetical protein